MLSLVPRRTMSSRALTPFPTTLKGLIEEISTRREDRSLIDWCKMLSHHVRVQIEKRVDAYDEDATLSVDLLISLSNCNGRIAATGMCLGGHLAFRAAFDPRVLASFCWFATDIHSATLGRGKNDDSLVKVRNGELTGKGELIMVFGKQDTHVPRTGRDLIRSTLEEANVPVTFLEVQAQHAFIRDESSKGRYDAALTRSLFGMMMEVFDRTVARDLGQRVVNHKPVEHVC
ncbi:hypothetical protein E1B28_001126 [Marasmius oreades]|uniref:Dienelactone hydrolase domain-containing protein n=1 Tax=Marasmius oreades TaxID=181124 RepID=A0A9P7V2S2_9AGAR|nr:uncharacterized protein E1B28_001126 [Marasmius oreades]KAG7099265.1 hypothetical protein E1B28_001126 [Marasmius oreades]